MKKSFELVFIFKRKNVKNVFRFYFLLWIPLWPLVFLFFERKKKKRNCIPLQIQLAFPDSNHFKLQRPNECEANFLDVFEEKTDLRSRLKNFCGSIADTVIVKSNLAYVRYYAEPKALNSTFEGVMTAIRDKEAGESSEFKRP